MGTAPVTCLVPDSSVRPIITPQHSLGKVASACETIMFHASESIVIISVVGQVPDLSSFNKLSNLWHGRSGTCPTSHSFQKDSLKYLVAPSHRIVTMTPVRPSFRRRR